MIPQRLLELLRHPLPLVVVGTTAETPGSVVGVPTRTLDVEDGDFVLEGRFGDHDLLHLVRVNLLPRRHVVLIRVVLRLPNGLRWTSFLGDNHPSVIVILEEDIVAIKATVPSISSLSQERQMLIPRQKR